MYDLIYYYYIVYAASAAAVAKTTACNNIRNGVRNLLVYNIVLYIIYITRGVFYDVLETIKTFGEIWSNPRRLEIITFARTVLQRPSI